jgi:hypothetical protein
MARVVWIASYPKSGNTWVRFIVHHLLGGQLGNLPDLQARVPDMYFGISKDRLDTAEVIGVKTHGVEPPKLPPESTTIGAIVIIRHPLDVLASNVNYHLMGQAGETGELSAAQAEQLRRAYIAAYIRHGGDPAFSGFGWGTWEENLAGWVEQFTGPRLLLRYERLLQLPEAGAARIAQFLGLKVSAEGIAAAARDCSFDEMRRIETATRRGPTREFIFRGPKNTVLPVDSPWRFVNSGRAGSYRDVLTPGELRQAIERFSPAARRFGYTMDDEAADPAQTP